MFPFLANLDVKPDSPLGIGAFCVAGAAVLHIVKLCLDTYKEHFKVSPDPGATYVPREEIRDMLEDAEDGMDAKLSDAEDRSKERAAANAKLLAEFVKNQDERHAENRRTLTYIGEKVENTFKEFRDNQQREIKGVHERMNVIAEDLAGIRGEMRHIVASAKEAEKSAVASAEAARGAIQAANESTKFRRS